MRNRLVFSHYPYCAHRKLNKRLLVQTDPDHQSNSHPWKYTAHFGHDGTADGHIKLRDSSDGEMREADITWCSPQQMVSLIRTANPSSSFPDRCPELTVGRQLVGCHGRIWAFNGLSDQDETSRQEFHVNLDSSSQDSNYPPSIQSEWYAKSELHWYRLCRKIRYRW